jgi:mono/diheme cytochrome c family protein
MSRLPVAFAVLLAAAWIAAAVPSATSRAPGHPGASLYQAHCAVCHGADAHGDGAWADLLAYRPADLTRIAIGSHGEFPATRVRDIIDGRMPVKGHFPTGMPVWGDVLKTAETGYSEAAARARVEALVDYLRTLQAMPADRRAIDVR